MAIKDIFTNRIKFRSGAGSEVFEFSHNVGVTFPKYDSALTAAAKYRGMPNYVESGTGVADVVGVVIKDENDAYINAYPVLSTVNNQGLIYATNIADFTLQNANTAQTWLAAAVDTLTVVASTTYFLEAWLYLTTGATSHTTSVGFAGTATATNARIASWATSAAATTLATPQMREITSLSAAAVTAASTAVTTNILLRGIVKINAGGTFIPQLTFSADPTGTCTANIGSFLRMQPIGKNTLASLGAWA